MKKLPFDLEKAISAANNYNDSYILAVSVAVPVEIE